MRLETFKTDWMHWDWMHTTGLIFLPSSVPVFGAVAAQSYSDKCSQNPWLKITFAFSVIFVCASRLTLNILHSKYREVSSRGPGRCAVLLLIDFFASILRGLCGQIRVWKVEFLRKVPITVALVLDSPPPVVTCSARKYQRCVLGILALMFIDIIRATH